MIGSSALAMRLDGRVAVVTGAGQGLGEVTAEVLGELGARLALLDLDAGRCQAVADRLVARGCEAIAIACDVADEPSVTNAAASIQQRFGRADILVNNAGIIAWTPLEDLSVEDWDRVMAVNLRGIFLCTKHFGRLMLARGQGSIVNISSVAGSTPEPNAGAYSATKAGAILLAKQTAVEWGPRGIRANAVSPGMMRTPMAEPFLRVPEALERRLAMTALHQIGDPREVAGVIAFLASDASSYVTGQNIEVDGGMMQMMIHLLPRPGVPGGAHH